jgi:hypothetical protein
MHLGSFGSSQAVATGPEGRQMIAQRVSAGFRPHMNTQPREGRQNPFPDERQGAIASPSPRATKRISRKASKPPRCPSSPIRNPPASTGLKSARSHSPATSSPNDRPTAPTFFAASRLRVRPFGLNPERMAAKITEGRNRTLFPTDEAVGPTRPGGR